MNFLFEGIREALRLILTRDPEVVRIALVSLRIATVSTLLAACTGIPLGFLIATRAFRGKRCVVTTLNTLFALPTVVVGLTVYAFLSRMGPLGSFSLLFTPVAIIIGQFILAFPIVSALSMAAVATTDPRAGETARALGASERQVAIATLRESRTAILAAVIAGFGRVFGEVGVSMMLGGNIRFYTRTITTAIALETGRGEFALAIALGIILLSVALAINILLQNVKQTSAS